MVSALTILKSICNLLGNRDFTRRSKWRPWCICMVSPILLLNFCVLGRHTIADLSRCCRQDGFRLRAWLLRPLLLVDRRTSSELSNRMVVKLASIPMWQSFLVSVNMRARCAKHRGLIQMAPLPPHNFQALMNETY